MDPLLSAIAAAIPGPWGPLAGVALLALYQLAQRKWPKSVPSVPLVAPKPVPPAAPDAAPFPILRRLLLAAGVKDVPLPLLVAARDEVLDLVRPAVAPPADPPKS